MIVNDQSNAKKSRVITYIDGFNLYFGLREKNWRKYLWLDLWEFSQALLLRQQVLHHVKYFTSRVRSNIGKQERQSAFLDALTTLKNVTIYWGRFQPDEKRCQKCGHYAYHPQEKKTDVNIATQLICDAFHDRFDTAIIISGDADLVPPIEAVKELFPKKRIVAAFPPERYSSELAGRAHAFMNIHENSFRRSRLPDHIDLPNGLHVDCPSKWK
jgi:uncharacterized LabA/DUF88 family protein